MGGGEVSSMRFHSYVSEAYSASRVTIAACVCACACACVRACMHPGMCVFLSVYLSVGASMCLLAQLDDAARLGDL